MAEMMDTPMSGMMLADSDDDSAVGVNDERLSISSLTSSIRAFHYENGRTYHAYSAGKYILPNDEKQEERDRLDMQNHHFLITFGGKMCFAPGSHTARRVLDIGTGTADAHPSAEVLGVDLSPIQPFYVPPNCSFEIDDLEKDWTWVRPFDYIFSRMMVGCFGDFTHLITQSYKHLTPGGWFEIIDSLFPMQSDDGTLKDHHALKRWADLLCEASNKLGRSLAATKDHRDRLIAAGFTNVTILHYKWPTNRWPKDPQNKLVGLWTLANIGGSLEGLSLALLTRGLGWSKEQVHAFLPEVRRDLHNQKIHAYFPISVVYGQKPSYPRVPTQ
ncbi:hypothetical protein FQN55_008668 [Onygenales sp. PD_40]|nr:hypothetical protein FQN55_008668 [Onygenales sp. PD_40]